MSEQWIFIKAHDVWMFRDSKPFTAGESFFARSMFPPQPGTTQGLIRSFHYEHTGQIIGSATDMGGLRLHGAFLATLGGIERAPADGDDFFDLHPAVIGILIGLGAAKDTRCKQYQYPNDDDETFFHANFPPDNPNALNLRLPKR